VFARVLAIITCALTLLVVPAPESHAQNDSSSVYIQRVPAGGRNPFEWLFGRQRSQPGATLNRDGSARSYKARRKSSPTARPSLTPSPLGPDGTVPPTDPNAPQTAETPAAPPVPPMTPVQIAVVGDSLSVLLAQGLQEIYAERPAVTFVRKNRDSSGLVRDDYYDWPKNLKDLLSATPNLDAVVIMVGSNDRQQLRDEAGVHEPRSERWNELYARRIDALIAIARDHKLPVVWVGLPTMRTERYRADVLAFNDIYRRRVSAAGATYVDIWEAFSGEDGDYVVTGPDVGGELVRLRTSDGVHFTKAGARKLAFFADKEIQKIVASKQEKLPPPAAASLDPGALPGLTAPIFIGPVLPALPQPEPLTIEQLPPVPAPRPLQGPVLVLTAPPNAAGGQLLNPNSIGIAKDAANVFITGRPPAAKPGRADDFTFTPQ